MFANTLLSGNFELIHRNGSTGQFRRWEYRWAIEIQPDQVDSNLTNFAYLLDTSVLNQLPNFWTTVLNGGGDIRITSDSNGANLLNTYVELCDTSTQQGFIWTKVPSISSSVVTRIYIFYGRSGVFQPAPSATGGYEGVWDTNTKTFLAMNDQLTPLDDFTANVNSFFTAGGLPDRVSGKHGFAQRFDGVGDYATKTAFNDVDFGTIFTFSAWFNPNNSSGGAVFGKGDGDGVWEFQEKQIMFGDGTTGGAQAGLRPTLVGNSLNWIISATAISSGTWSKVDWVYNSTGPVRQIFINGVSQSLTLANYSGVADVAGWDGMLGRQISSDVNQDYDGLMDSVKISNAQRSAAWLKFEYQNQNNASNTTIIPPYVIT